MAIMLSEIEKDIDSCKIALGNKDKQLLKAAKEKISQMLLIKEIFKRIYNNK